MKYRQIGNGSAFNYKMPNSSFLIENNNKYLLFDCGNSVYAELRKQDEAGEIDLKKLDSVYISHMDDDHMGSLKTLLYYQYFVNGITTKVYAHAGVFTDLSKMLNKTNCKLENGKYIDASIVEVIEIVKFEDPLIVGLSTVTVSCSHHTECYGLWLQEDMNSSIFITGDTKATEAIARVIRTIKSLSMPYKIFHDFSNWDCEGSQVHACKSDTERLYSQEVRDAIIWYHNDAEFDRNWQTI